MPLIEDGIQEITALSPVSTNECKICEAKNWH